jgi:hypothetical protein
VCHPIRALRSLDVANEAVALIADLFVHVSLHGEDAFGVYARSGVVEAMHRALVPAMGNVGNDDGRA